MPSGESEGGWGGKIASTKALFSGFRFVSFVAALTLVVIDSKYIQALVMLNAGAHMIGPILLVIFSALLLLYSPASAYLFLHRKKVAGIRYRSMGYIDLCLAALYLPPMVWTSIQLSAVSCDKEQFMPGHLNRYGMGYFSTDHTLQSWAKSSESKCTQSKAAMAMCFIAGIACGICSGIELFTWHQDWSGKKGSQDQEMDKPYAGGPGRPYGY